MSDDAAETREARRGHVKLVRKAARSCGRLAAELCKDSAGREKVQVLAQKVEASDGDAEFKAAASAAFAAYLATYGEAGGAEEEGGNEEEEEKGFRLRGTSFLFTYNWGFFGKPFPDDTPPVASRRKVSRQDGIVSEEGGRGRE